MKKFITIILLFTIIFQIQFGASAYAAEEDVHYDYESGNLTNVKNYIENKLNQKTVMLTIKYSGKYTSGIGIIDSIVSQDNFLYCNISGYTCKATKYSRGSEYLYTIYNFEVTYNSSAAQDKMADTKIKQILSKIITDDMYTYEKVKAVNDYIVLHSKYDQTYTKNTDYDILFSGTAVCNGYALLTYKMLNALYIPTLIVRGTANGDNHAWNLVNVDGKWFNLDTTWNDPLPDRNTVSYNYFMLSDSEISSDHKRDSSVSLPSAYTNYNDYLSQFKRTENQLITNKTCKDINIKIHDSYVDFKEFDTKPVEPFIQNGRTLVPLRAVFATLGCNVNWNDSTRTATIKYLNNTFTITANSSYAYSNSKKVTLDVPATILNGRIMVPIRAISEAFNNIVLWDANNRTVLIY